MDHSAPFSPTGVFAVEVWGGCGCVCEVGFAGPAAHTGHMLRPSFCKGSASALTCTGVLLL